MKFLSRTLPGMALATVLAACSTDIPTEAAPTDLAAAKGGPGVATHTSIDIGAMLGGYASRVNDVNDAGDVVGVVFSSSSCCAFAIIGDILTQLPGNGREAHAISNSSPLHVVGYSGAAGVPTQPLRWTISDGVSSQPASLELGGASYGSATGVNDAGEAVGYAGASAAIWSADGSLTAISPPQGFAIGRGRDINNSGHAVFDFGPVSLNENARAYLRLASGALFELPPLAGDPTSHGTGISDVENNMVYISGYSEAPRLSETGPVPSRAVRWTVDVNTGGIIATQVRQEDSYANGVSNAGGVVGVLRGRKAGPYLWRGTELLTLKPPKGMREGWAFAISPSGEFVAGEAYSPKVGSNAVRWTILSP